MNGRTTVSSYESIPMPIPRSHGPMLQRKCACGKHTTAGGECEECKKKKDTLQRKLVVGASNDSLEQEADRVANQVLANQTNPAVTNALPKIRRFSGTNTEQTVIAPASVDRVLTSPGVTLDPTLQKDMGQRFGHDFSMVRVYADAAAAQSAQDVNARAYTVGHNIVFGKGQFEPETYEGRRLLAHELTHVVQQDSSGVHGLQREATDDPRLDDPNFLVCLALCYIGLPPSLWRTLVNRMLSAMSVEYRGQYGEVRGAEMFREFAAVFSTWSSFNKAKAVISFLGESRVGLITIQAANAQAVRQAVLRVLERAGIRSGAIATASQILRKTALILEAVWAAGCFAYCTAEQYAIFVRDLSLMAIEAVVNVIEAMSTVLGAVGEAIGSAIGEGFLRTQAMLDVSNWRFAPDFPARARRHLNVIASISRLAVNADSFLSYIGRTLGSMDIQPLLLELAEDLNSAMSNRGGFSQLVHWDVGLLQGLTPLTLINLLVDYRFISYIQSPDEVAAQGYQQSQ